MKTKETVEKYLEYQKSNLKPQTFKNHKNLLRNLREEFKDKEIEEITSADVFAFLTPENRRSEAKHKTPKVCFREIVFQLLHQRSRSHKRQSLRHDCSQKDISQLKAGETRNSQQGGC